MFFSETKNVSFNTMNDFNLTISGVFYMGMQAAPTTDSENTNRP